MTEKLPNLDQAFAKISKDEAHFNNLLTSIDDPKYRQARFQGFGRALVFANSERRRTLQLEQQLKLAEHVRDRAISYGSAIYQTVIGKLTEADIHANTGLTDPQRETLLNVAAVYTNHLSLLEMLGPKDDSVVSPAFNPAAETVGSV